MPKTRRFLVAPALTRVIRKKYGSEQVAEGYFPPQAGRQSHVRTENGRSYLVLTLSTIGAEASQEIAELPNAHAEALLEVCPGTLSFERSVVRLRRHEAVVDLFRSPGPLNVVSVEFTSVIEASAFLVPGWFGGEVSDNEDYSNSVIASFGVTPPDGADASNAGLESLLDMLEGYTAISEHDEERVRRVDALPVTARAKSLQKALGLPAMVNDNAASTVKLDDPSPVLGATPDRHRLGDEWLAKLINAFSTAHPAHTHGP
jgi:CYTH domain-containing protein